MSGAIDEVRIWNVARQASDIQDFKDRQIEANTTGLVGYWPLDEGTGTLAQDKTSYGRHKNLTAVSSWQTPSTSPVVSFAVAGYRYGFNGKEKDLEGMGGGGSTYDYGFRIYNPQIARFLSVDPLSSKFPNESPYIYAGNSPIVNIDVEGKFKIHIHIAILERAFKTIKISKNSYINDMILSNMRAGVSKDADILGAFSDYHFDGRQNFQAVQNTWIGLDKNLNKQIDEIANKTKIGQNGFDPIPSGSYRDFGIMIHTVQDFYSHSNYVELYIEYYKSQNNGEFPKEVPLYDEGVKIEGFRALMEQTSYDKNGKYEGLYSGEFDLGDNEFWDFRWTGDNHTGPNSHKHTNKDKVNTKAGKLAKDAAIRHTKKYLNKLEENTRELEKRKK